MIFSGICVHVAGDNWRICYRVAQTVGGNFFIFPKLSYFYIGYEGIAEQSFWG